MANEYDEALNSPFARLYDAILNMLKAVLTKTELAYIDWDLGQMENYNPAIGGRPKVSFPAGLIDMENFNFDEEGELQQRSRGIVLIRLCYDKISPTDNLAPSDVRARGLSYFNTEHKVNMALHGKSPGDGFGYFTRVSSSTEKREDAFRVRQIRYDISFVDKSTLIAQQKASTDINLVDDWDT